jgi:hypothetical protein
VLCRAVNLRDESINMRSRPSVSSLLITRIPPGASMDVVAQERSSDDGRVWYRVTSSIEGARVEGWVRSDTVITLTECPILP